MTAKACRTKCIISFSVISISSKLQAGSPTQNTETPSPEKPQSSSRAPLMIITNTPNIKAIQHIPRNRSANSQNITPAKSLRFSTISIILRSFLCTKNVGSDDDFITLAFETNIISVCTHGAYYDFPMSFSYPVFYINRRSDHI